MDKIRTKMINKYYTTYGEKTLENRLNNLVEVFKTQKIYPFKARMLGFPTLMISCKAELFYRIKEICDLIGLKMNVFLEKREEK